MFGGIGIRLLTQRDNVRSIALGLRSGGPARRGVCGGTCSLLSCDEHMLMRSGTKRAPQ